MLPRTLKNFSLFVDGRGYAGKVDELTLPKLSRKMEEYRAGGMAAPVEIDMGMEKLECNFTLSEYSEEVLRLWGLTDVAGCSLKFKGSLEADDASGTQTPVEVIVRGRWRELDMGGWKGGDKATLKVAVAVSYYKYTSGGQDLIEIDVPGMIEKVGGVDRLAATRANLGL